MIYDDKTLELRRQRAKAWNKAHPERVKDRAQRYYRLRKARGWKQEPLNKKVNRTKIREWRIMYPWYDSWQAIKQRCNNPKNPRYKYYGGKGITCTLTKLDMSLMWTRDNAASMHRPSVDRINPAKGYSLDNCHFLETSDNSRKAAIDRMLESARVADNKRALGNI